MQGRGRRGAGIITLPRPGWPLRLPGAVLNFLRDAPAFFPAAITAESERRGLFLWLPVFFGVGICLYFTADIEPAITWPACLTLLFAVLAWLMRNHLAMMRTLLALTMLFAGFSASILRTADVAKPILGRPMIGPLAGIVETIEKRGEGVRILVRVQSFAGLEDAARPYRVRVTHRDKLSLKPGDGFSATARLLPPPEPARPGGYDFARDSFFRSIGAVGSIIGKVAINAPKTPFTGRDRFDTMVDDARNNLTERIAGAFGGQAGAVAAALVTGKRGFINEDTNDALRAAGVYHIVSISGLHMVLAAGAIFWVLRAVLSLVPGLVLLWPVKKISALVAMAGATAYCIFSGSDVATERSLIMTLVMLGAVLVDRPALSMRNLAIAALIVLALEPESLLGPSFQMSFGAVAGLIAFCSRLSHAPSEAGSPIMSERQHKPRAQIGGIWSSALHFAQRFWSAAVALVLTTLIASIATAPFTAYHFQVINPLGVIGNALTLPFVSIIVMPAAVAGVFLAPLGLDRPIWWLMGAAVEPVLTISSWLETIDVASLGTPAFGLLPLVLFIFALLISTLPSGALRWSALVPALVGLGLAHQAERFDILIDRDAMGVAVRTGSGQLSMMGNASAFVKKQWLLADGDRRDPGEPDLRNNIACDRLGCVARLKNGRSIVLVLSDAALVEDCARADVIVTRFPAPECKAPVVIDRPMLSARGAIMLKATSDGFVMQGARDGAQSRPWVRSATKQARIAAEDANGQTAPVAQSPSGQKTNQQKTSVQGRSNPSTTSQKETIKRNSGKDAGVVTPAPRYAAEPDDEPQ
jgi:competence protein ComEC